jgi:NADH:ubiquinone oxidoreductase subunit 5 (subunit L)/multisubunit Na+/H+ antiporter MnhA subunit
MEFVAVIVTPFILAALMPVVCRYVRAPRLGWVLLAVMTGLFVFLLSRLPPGGGEAAQVFTLPWVPEIGLAFTLYIDGLALMFAVLVTGVGAAVLFYAGYYVEDYQRAGRFQAFMLAFTGSMLLLVMAGNLLTLFIAWELTSVFSFLLIGFKGADEEARMGASQALIITGGGGLALIAGLLLMGSAAGTMSLGEILSSGDLLRQHPWYSAITILVLLGCFAKSAQYPLHFWLPGAMSAPTPASAFLHSATMVKAGVYLLARFYPALGDTPLWSNALMVTGLATMLIAAVLALRQYDMKGILAYTTISQLGALVALVGLPNAAGMKAAMIGILAHALYKGALFLISGTVDRATGTRNVNELGGLRRLMPGLAVITALVGLSMAGVPPFFGFVAKETLLEAVMAQPLALAVVALSATLTVTAALGLFWDVFMGKTRISLPQMEHVDHDQHHPLGDDAYDYSHHYRVPRWMSSSPALLAGLSVVMGIWVGPLATPLVQAGLGKPVSLYLLPPDGLNAAFAISMTALLAGTALFAVRRIWRSWSVRYAVSGTQVYGGVIRATEAVGDQVLKTQAGAVRPYLIIILSSVMLLLATVISSELGSLRDLSFTFRGVTDVIKVLLLLLAVVATLASILFKRHLVAVLMLGIAGYAIGGIFLLEPAPDVALVQFLVETLVTVLIIMILARTSDEERRKAMDRLWDQTRLALGRDVLISALIGTAVGVFALAAVSARPSPSPIAAWHLENALPLAGVNDVVAGILTDFRGTDTLIEITVFGMAALGVLTMLARRGTGKAMALVQRRRVQTGEPNGSATREGAASEQADSVYGSRFTSPLTNLAAVIVLPLAILIGAAHILYGGVGPGDGFTAGAIAGLGITLWYVVFGYTETKQRLRWLHPVPLIGIGLVVAITNAVLPLLFGSAFFSLTKIEGVSVANIKVASSLLFEVAIFLAVFGSASAIMEAITHPREVEPL